MTYLKYVTLLVSVVFITVSCSNKKTLQSYLVEKSGQKGFYTADLPVSSLFTKKTDISKDAEEAIKSVQKINVTYLQKTDSNTMQYAKEKETLKTIFKDNTTYKSLMEMKLKGGTAKVYYAGNTDAINEVVIFGFADKQGVGVARLLGDNMNPTKIIESLNALDYNKAGNGISTIINGFVKN